ncbi:MAG: M48 family metalloprotease [Methanoregulaceae archaeon]|nr:M48 family metalloprotease [Methanoregulaceae archaeon]
MIVWELLAAVCLAGIVACIYLRQYPVAADTDPEDGFKRIWLTWSKVGTIRLAFEVGLAVFTLGALLLAPPHRIIDPLGKSLLMLSVGTSVLAMVIADKVRQIRFIKIAPFAGADAEVKDDPKLGWVVLGAMSVVLAAAVAAAIVVPMFQLKIAVVMALVALSWSAANTAAYAYIFRKPSAIDKFPAIESLIERSGIKVSWVGWSPGTIFNAMAISGNRVVLFGPISSLEEHEVLAVVSHELAHLKHNDVPRYQNLSRLTGGLAWLGLVGVVMVSGPDLTFAQLMTAVLAGRIGLLVGGFISSGRKKEIEHRADRYAAELTSADAISDGLTKLHLRGGIPDRWLPWEEPFISHPALEARIARLRVS